MDWLSDTVTERAGCACSTVPFEIATAVVAATGTFAGAALCAAALDPTKAKERPITAATPRLPNNLITCVLALLADDKAAGGAAVARFNPSGEVRPSCPGARVSN